MSKAELTVREAGSETPAVAPVVPSIHVRAIATWAVIFPLVAIGMLLMAPFSEGWPPILRALVLSLFIVPLAVYVVLPAVFSTYGRVVAARRAARTDGPRSGSV